MKLANDYINQNKERFLEELFDLLRIPSISAQPSLHKQDMVRCAEWLAASLVKAGADRAEVMPTEGFLVCGTRRQVLLLRRDRTVLHQQC